MTKRIALFNHKGGIGKTTTVFNLGWMLAEKGHRVVLVDADPQCDLTEMVLGFGGRDIGDFYENDKGRNLKDGLAPAFESRPEPLKAVDCFPVKGRDGLFLLTGHIGLSHYEIMLDVAQRLSGYTEMIENLPGSITRLLELTAEKHRADYVLIDLNSGLNSFNQNLVSTSHCFIVPTGPDYFSAIAAQTLSQALPDWRKWAMRAAQLPTLKNAVYPFPDVTPKLLGAVIQNYRPRDGKSAGEFQTQTDKIGAVVAKDLFPRLEKAGITLPEPVYAEHGAAGFCLAAIPDFNSLIAKSQRLQTPVYQLTAEQLGRTRKSLETFKEIHSDLADKVISLANYATGA